MRWGVVGFEMGAGFADAGLDLRGAVGGFLRGGMMCVRISMFTYV